MNERTMSVPATRHERFAIIQRFVAERLFKNPEEVTLKSRLVGDLGADSLDFVDLQFQMEHWFDLHFESGEFFDFGYGWVTPDGYLRADVVERVGDFVPELRSEADPTRIPVGTLLNSITVETLLRIVEQKSGLEAKR